jgi:hypothetical protein
LATPADQQRLVARVLDQGVAEIIDAVLRRALRQHDFRSDKTPQYPIDFALRLAGDGS